VAPKPAPVAAAPKPAAPAPQPAAKVEQPAQPAASTARMDDNPYAPKRGQLDTMGRVTPAEKPVSEDDQLDIPAFLRRQAN
jgi:cell division protein FtsZ